MVNSTRIPIGKLFLPRVGINRLRDLQEAETNISYKRRYDAAVLRKEGKTMSAIAKMLDVSAGTIGNWLYGMTVRGVGKKYKLRQGRPPKFTPKQLKELERDMKKSPRAYNMDTDNWTSATVSDYAQEKFEVDITPGSMRRLLLRENINWPGSAKAMAEARKKSS